MMPDTRYYAESAIAYRPDGEDDEKQVKAGGTVDDIPADAARWLEAQGAIRQLPDTPDTPPSASWPQTTNSNSEEE